MITAVGRWFNSKIKNFIYAAGFFFLILKETVLFIKRKQVGRKVLTMQILFTGVEALGVIALLALVLGAALIIQGISLLPQFGQGDLIYSILIIVITRELGPILTAFIIIARSATAIATEIGTKVISHEIEAYISIGINPISYLAVPRFLGVTLSVIILNLYFNFFGLIGSYFVTILIRPLKFSEYFRKLLFHIQTADILSSLVKSVAFGVIISSIALYQGFKVRQASYEIPQIAIKAVVQSFVYCIIANAVITMIYYL